MRLQIVLLMMIVAKGKVAAGSNILSRTRLVDMLQKLCPGVNVCRENQTIEEPDKTFKPGFESCCTECSCGPDCADYGNCCFPETLPAKQSYNMTAQMTTECLFPMTVQPGVVEQVQLSSYSMISSVSSANHGDTTSTTDESCGEQRVAPWGSMYPLYSPKRKRIYKNNACAVADNIDDGQLWDAVILCNGQVDDVTFDASSFVLGMDSGNISDLCHVNFVYQGNMEDLKPSKCYVNLLDSCDASEFQIPKGVDYSLQDITDACSSGLVSPFREFKLYANVFCQICNGNWFSKDTFCRMQLEGIDASRGAGNRHAFTALIDTSFIKELAQNVNIESQVHPKACLYQKNRECRVIFCPSGQLRDLAGECRFPNRLWYYQQCVIVLNLTTDVAFDIQDLFHAKPGVSVRNMPDINSPWLKTWIILSIWCEKIAFHQNTTKLVVVLKYKQSPVEPTRFVRNIEKMVDREWVFRYHNKTKAFRSNLRKHTAVTGKDSILIVGNRSQHISRTSLSPVYLSYDVAHNEHVLTKMYLCDQVELSQSEFILSSDKSVLFNNITKDLLFYGQFTMVGQTSENARARVCIEDSGLYPLGRNKNSPGSSISYSFFILVISSVLQVIRKCF